METQILVHFTLSNFDIDPKEITTLLGIEPSKTWKKGDLIRSNSKRSYNENGWNLKSNPESVNELDNHITYLIEILKPKWSELLKITNNCYSEISCAIYIEDEIPSIHFEKDILKYFVELNAEIDLAIYDLREKDSD